MHLRVKNRYAILTAAHCIPKTVKFNNKLHKVETNTHYPTIESMLSIYLGIHDIAFLRNHTQNRVTVSNVIRVKIL